MFVAEFQNLNPCIFPDEMFVVEPAATLSRLEVDDDSMATMTTREACRQDVVRCKCRNDIDLQTADDTDDKIEQFFLSRIRKSTGDS